MAFLCPVRRRKFKAKSDPASMPFMQGRITGSASIDTLVRVGQEKEYGLDTRMRMVVLRNFRPCVEDELAVTKGQKVKVSAFKCPIGKVQISLQVLYQENDWLYVIADNGGEGFVPFSYCAPWARSVDDFVAHKLTSPSTVTETERRRSTSYQFSPMTNDASLFSKNITSTSLPDINHISPNRNHSNQKPNATVENSYGSLGRNRQMNTNSQREASTTIQGQAQSRVSRRNMPLRSSTGTTYRSNRMNSAPPAVKCSMDNLRATPAHNTPAPQQRGVSLNRSQQVSLLPPVENGVLQRTLRQVRPIQNPASQQASSTPPKRITVHSSDTPMTSLSNLSQQQHQLSSQRYQTRQSDAQSQPSDTNNYHDMRKVSQGVGMPQNMYPTQRHTRSLSSSQALNQSLDQSSTGGLSAAMSEPETFLKSSHGRYIALFSFEALEENDIKVQRGDFVTVLNTDDNQWFWVKRSDGNEGFVPSSFLCPAEGQQNVITQRIIPTSLPTSPINQPNRHSNGPHAQHPFLNSVRLLCLYDFTAQAPQDLSTRRGDWLYADLNVDNRSNHGNEWIWAYSVAARKYGYVPRSYVKFPQETSTKYQNSLS